MNVCEPDKGRQMISVEFRSLQMNSKGCSCRCALFVGAQDYLLMHIDAYGLLWIEMDEFR